MYKLQQCSQLYSVTTVIEIWYMFCLFPYYAVNLLQAVCYLVVIALEVYLWELAKWSNAFVEVTFPFVNFQVEILEQLSLYVARPHLLMN